MLTKLRPLSLRPPPLSPPDLLLWALNMQTFFSRAVVWLAWFMNGSHLAATKIQLDIWIMGDNWSRKDPRSHGVSCQNLDQVDQPVLRTFVVPSAHQTSADGRTGWFKSLVDRVRGTYTTEEKLDEANTLPESIWQAQNIRKSRARNLSTGSSPDLAAGPGGLGVYELSRASLDEGPGHLPSAVPGKDEIRSSSGLSANRYPLKLALACLDFVQVSILRHLVPTGIRDGTHETLPLSSSRSLE
ncbi:hypothetical protein FA13DRAFT_1717633 [Coprinellus micaceus]|uniref:Uncharacterized protein n=1 Tax=Coprinellus micaceus TaxID=71717 RepID=A0A4Y7SGA3_COPMI|nr:hypothetical protein FA13DRAFT_1717633 [Coprinellus micaceus]